MTKLYDGTILQGLPEIIAKQPYAQALSYAIRNMFRRILTYADKARTYSGLDVIDDPDLMDALAYELRASPYSEDYAIEIKRELVRFALQYWSAAGTKAATEEVVRRVFHEAEISEWFEYGGDPGYFRIGITDTTITSDTVAQFKAAAENVKRLSAWLDKVQMWIRFDPWHQHIAHILHDCTAHTMRMHRDGTFFVAFAVQDGTTHTFQMSK